MDSRDLEKQFGSWYDSFDEKRMVFHVLDEGEEEIEIPAIWEVCGLCDGRGKHVNPSIDSQGLTAEDFENDPDLHEDYFSGMYDEVCYRCHGRTTEPVIDEEHCSPTDLRLVNKLIEDRYDMIREREYEMRMGL